MLLSYSVENYKCFKNEGCISLFATEDIKYKNRYTDSFYHYDDATDVFRSAVIFGENGGGKSNFFESIKYLQHFFKENNQVRSASNCLYDSGKSFFDKIVSETIQSFNVEFIYNNKRYAYYLEIDVMGIREEAVYVHDGRGYNTSFEVYRITNVDDYKITELKNVSIIENDIIINEEGISESWIDDFKDNQNQSEWLGLHVSRLAVMGVKTAIAVVKWFTNRLVVERSKFYNYDVKLTDDINDEYMIILHSQKFIDIVKMADNSIIDVEIDNDKPFYNSYLVRKDSVGNEYKCMLKDDSSGIREFFAWSIQLYKVVYDGITLIADEIDRAFNATLSSKILAYINGMDHKGQLIFTTHNVLHMTFKVFMKGQMFIITKDTKTLMSDIISLTEYLELTYDNHKVYEYYVNGLLGGTVSE